MAKRLAKIAQELNVGSSTIVEHLNSVGFDITNKPHVKITEEMETELLNKFQNSLAIKKEADKLKKEAKLGKESQPTKKVKKTTSIFKSAPEGKEIIPPAKEVEEEVKTPKDVEETPEKVVPQDAAVKKDDAQEVIEKTDQQEEVKTGIQLNIKGKIDLDKLKKPKKKRTEEAKEPEQTPPPQKESVKKEPEHVEDTEEKTSHDETTPIEKKAPPEEKKLMRAKTPELRGLKVLGKIDADRIKKKKKKTTKEKSKEKDAPDEKKSSRRPDSSSKRRRRRIITRSVDVKSTGAKLKGKSRRPVKEKEISQKEIDEKLKETMARLKGGNKKKRQRLRRDKRELAREKQEQRERVLQSEKIQVTEFISAQELANVLDISVTDIIMTCMNLGVIVSINQRLDAEIIELVAEEFEKEIEFISAEEQDDDADIFDDDPENLVPRPPIVTVMGHVDHGKTSLLDYVKNTNIASGEAGGITQHIGAYEVVLPESNKKITFLDTPGHEAFTAMRARGAKITDIAIIVIAADDKIMPQTKEAISHVQAAGVPMIFAINKIDKPDANPEKIKEELAAMNLLVEDWGGKYQSQDISAKTGLNVMELLEKVVLEAEMLELKANPNRLAIGSVLEASLDKGKGYVTKILVQTGTLKIGDPIVAGAYSGKVKALYDEHGKKVKSAGPSTPVLLLGLNGAPQAGERLKVMESEKEANNLAVKRSQINREQTTRATKRVSLEEIGRRLALGSFKELNLIIKGDVDGSVEALSGSLIKLSQETVSVNVIHKAVGHIIESDVLLAAASDSIIIGFQVRPLHEARKLAEKEGIQIKTYSVIYKVIDDIKAAIEGLLEPTVEEVVTANVAVKEVYKISKVGTIAGCLVSEGKITRNTKIRLIRDGIVIYPTKEGVIGEIASLKRIKDDVSEVKAGLECGIGIKNFNDIKVGDVIEGYEIKEIKRKI